MDDYQPMSFDFLDENIMFIRDLNIPGPEEGPEPGLRWTVMFDGASNAQGNGIGAIITSPTGFHLPFTARLCFNFTNNMVEYEACIFGIEATIDLRIKILEVYGDSALVISQVRGDWEVRDHKLISCKEHDLKRIPYFIEITFHHFTMASMFKVEWKTEAPSICIDYLDEPTYYLAAQDESDGHPWFYDINRYLEKQEYPENASITDKKYL
ncbi:uncharacterized protein LOC127101878 [Lathyrus oleraceus]|uniref:uncharacterized protein LOC127101878 n=1 Tax=Pisum sativum TaxID=3888 RepID=UPI0021CF735A|nr:uncharacterized protein LOC127101878 [Pisum sativum]